MESGSMDVPVSQEQQRQQQDFNNIASDEENCYDRSKLKILLHSAICPSESPFICPKGFFHCCPSKRLFSHIIACTATAECDVPGCSHSRKIWKHYRTCSGRYCEKTHLNCKICSAVSVPYNRNNFCLRFRTERKSSRYNPTEEENNTDTVNFDIDSVEVAAGQSQRVDRGQYHRLPVWRKRNMIHAQQHQEQQPYQKENLEMAIANPSTKSSSFRRGGGGSALRASDRLSNRLIHQQNMIDRHAVTTSTGNKDTAKGQNIKKKDNPRPIKISIKRRSIPTVNDECNNNTGSFAGRDSGFIPMQFPVHPRDTRRRQSGLKPVARRSSGRVV